MNWTFGIITDGSNTNQLYEIVRSINGEFQDVEPFSYEIIIVGNVQGLKWEEFPIRIVQFDESQKKAWITRKKNIIAEKAQYDNLCIMHDYVQLIPGWKEGFENFGADWSHCMTPIANKNGIRFRDWVTYDSDNFDNPPPNTVRFLDYNDDTKTNRQYISGTYFCVKKEWMLEYPFDEKRTWGQSEDCEWSFRQRGKWNYRLNPHSMVQLMKQKDPYPMTQQRLL